jgi:sigma-54 dependent transcriptional regulator, acetoin dehydrogenase operon transcriptional activator AcoR
VTGGRIVDQQCRSVLAAREVLGLDAHQMPATSAGVRPAVYESWRRCKLQGLEPERVSPVYAADLELDTYLTRAVESVVGPRRAVLEQTGCALSLTDQDGRLLRRWVRDPAMTRRLDALAVAPRYSFAESDVGTTSAIALLSGAPVLVHGPEHFAEGLREFSCAGAPIAHPISHKVLGTLDVTCLLPDASPFVLAWVTELAREVEHALRDAASRREQLLLRSYLSHNHDSRHPLVVLDQHTIISNAVAARLLDPMDQALLWEHASRVLAERRSGDRTLALSGGGRISVATSAVTDGGDTVGAVLRLKLEAAPGPAAAPRRAELPGLVGVSAAWRTVCERAGRARSRSRLLVTGEPGSGRTAVARALAGGGPVRVLDARDAGTAGRDGWQDALAHRPGETLLLRHADRLDGELARLTEAALPRGDGSRVIATAGPGAPGQAPAGGLPGAFDAVLEVPPLRTRLDDLPVLLRALTARATGPAGEVRWAPDAVQALSRLDWPGNVAALDALVRRVVADRLGRDGRVGAADLPADVVAGAARRPLAALEQAEATAILTALRDASGNKERAARSLGIARSTLYRKMRALGLDLSASAF